MKSLFLSLIVVVVLLSCTTSKVDKEELPVARVYDKYLYANDLKNVVPNNLSQIDSLALIKDYIDKWVRKQLLLYQAELNLTEEEKNVEKQIQDYRTSLLIFIYEQNLIGQKLDTNLSEEEALEYYQENSSNFILNNNLVKALYIKVPKSAPDIWKLRRWYQSDKEEDIKELEAYCFNNAEKYDYFNDDWVEFRVIEEQLPRLYTSAKNILSTRNTIELQDDNYRYFVRIFDYRLEGTVAPLEYVRHNIYSIILNKRKIQYINRLEADIYNDALNHGNFNIY
ncbi:MAG: peptidyl-prolyl cis-trans isomerase [Bacteroidales bacterium]|nr:peptidyl-prolyl cis-trans isomerase [Bacteroidales bacterium]MBN2818748.1 peptidyl-prolyl cis-trans isomerase [Bacteroidales bacterium]